MHAWIIQFVKSTKIEEKLSPEQLIAGNYASENEYDSDIGGLSSK